MEKSYTKAYFSIYIFQFLSVVLGVLSLFIVVPYLSSNKFIFGIYSICVSLTIYFNYADMGFVTSGQKFVAEAFAKGDKKSELEIISFVTFLLLLFMSFVSLVILLFSYNPHWLISGLISLDDVEIARKLLLILAFSSPIIAFQRILSIIYSVRMEDYKYQRILIVGNLLKILSVFFFFSGGEYRIVEYYLFFQITTFVVTFVSFIYAISLYSYNIKLFLLNIRFNIVIFNKLKKLAYASLFSMLCWVLYYELDQIVIGKLMNPINVSVYAIAFSVLTLFRTFLGVIYSPFTSRFNHFIAINDRDGLKKMFLFVTKILFPFSVFPILIVSLLAEPFLYSWVGIEYNQSVDLTSLLVFCNIFAFFSYPAQAYIVASSQIRALYVIALVNVIVFWTGILLFFNSLELYSFAIFKVSTFVLSAIFYFRVVMSLLSSSKMNYFIELSKKSLLPVVTIIILCIFVKPYMFFEKGVEELCGNMIIMIIIMIIGCILSIFTFSEVREYMDKIKHLYYKKED
ncbi:MAG: hypothetical protein PARBA_00186 [Parabacteroides sp.]